MATFRSFEEIDAWKKAQELVREIYSQTKSGAFSKDFGLRGQIRRAGVSVMSNIAEGHERGGTKEFVRFLAIAKGSAGEVRSQLYVALDQGYLATIDFDRLHLLAVETGRMINGLISYLRKRSAPTKR